MKNALLIIMLLGITPLLSGCLEGKSQRISRDSFGDTWPFTVDTVELRCIGFDNKLLAVSRAKIIYALNQAARKAGYRPVESIWRRQDGIISSEFSLKPVIKIAEKQCVWGNF
ncbi:DUF2511 domain-containing protein [Dongshaea marina]|uniref:DUF2511 domain-containing protein n=1 Tax=Dongshaea marina TaxID=2047966 RepID=UPI00131EFB0D|nr:DUF2511 domain-containing protein [Dongshaea marina]